jgi:hypothetical protein
MRWRMSSSVVEIDESSARSPDWTSFMEATGLF